MTAGTEPDVWSLVRRPGQVDAGALWAALGRIGPPSQLDYRSRLLVHEIMEALAALWGASTLASRLADRANGETLKSLWVEHFAERGFPSLEKQLVEATTPEAILRMLRDLGMRLRQPATVTIGGSSALMLANLLLRQTEDVDVVDEIPPAVRADPALVDELAARHKLRLTHFASHYLPDGWEGRVRSLGRFDRLDARVVDAVDVLCGKLFSRRPKDLDDLLAAWDAVDREALRDRVYSSTTRLRSDGGLAEAARHAWYVLSGEAALP